MLINYLLLVSFLIINIFDAIGDGIRYLIEIKKEPIAGWKYKLFEALALILAFSTFAFIPALNTTQFLLLSIAFILIRYFSFDFTFLIVTNRKLRDFGNTSLVDKIQKWMFNSPFGVVIMISVKVLSLVLSMILLLDIIQF